MPLLLLLVSASILTAGGWDKEKAAQYLDQRQKEWFEFKPASAPYGPCVSCHTGLLYLMARPALRRAMNQPNPTEYETGLLSGLEKRLAAADGKHMFPGFAKEPLTSQAVSVEAIIAAFNLRSAASMERLWATPIKWFDLKLNPWEEQASAFYGAALAAVAASDAPKTPGFKEGVRKLNAYIELEQAAQPLHHRLTLLWVSRGFKDVRRQIAEQTLAAQQPDGGWTLGGLGPWAKPLRNPSSASDTYATALATYSLLRYGFSRTDVRIVRALDWVESHQDRHSGTWKSESQNKEFQPDSIPAQFMTDAATSFAVLALLEGGRR